MKSLLSASVLLCCMQAASVRAAEALPIYNPATAGGAGNFNTSWPGFEACWKRRQQQFAATRDADRGALVFFGDSITEMAPLEKLFPGRHVANRGISGDTSRGLLFRLDDNVLALEPSAVVILCGANDMVQPGKSAASTAANVREICRAIHARFPSIPVVVLKILPNSQAGEEVVKEFNHELDRAMAGLEFVTRADTHAPYLMPDGSVDPTNFKDGVHPNDKGYGLYGKILAPLLEKVRQSPP